MKFFLKTLLVMFALNLNANELMYLLQADALAEEKENAVKIMSQCPRTHKVIDMHFDEDTPYTKEDVVALRGKNPNCKIIAYLSIGEAEDYRSYWQNEWNIETKRPKFLLGENPDWKGNFRVKYWDASWQKIVFANVQKIAETGFDGIYMDIVDGFENFEFNQKTNDWEDGKINPETKQSYRKDMVDFVLKIAELARTKNKNFLIFPQNATPLLADKKFLDAISGIGVEDLFSNGNKAQKKSDTREVLKFLTVAMSKKNMPVFCIEYCGKNKPLCEDVKKSALESKISTLITDRDLKTLGDAFSEKPNSK